MYGLKNGKYHDHVMRLDQSHARKALIAVYSNDYFTLTQLFKQKLKKYLYEYWRLSLQIRRFTFVRAMANQAVAAWCADFSVIQLLVYVIDHRSFPL